MCLRLFSLLAFKKKKKNYLESFSFLFACPLRNRIYWFGYYIKDSFLRHKANAYFLMSDVVL